MEKQNLAIMYNGVAGDVPCAICGCEGETEVGLVMCLANSKQIVCQECARQHDPVLAQEFGHLMCLKQGKKRVDRVLPGLSQILDTVGVLATVLKFNEKKDVSYVGKMLAGAAENMQKELIDLDEIPF